MIKTTFEERRQAVRAKRILSIKYRLHKSKYKINNRTWHLSTTEDMSAVGLAFTTEEAYQPDDVLELHVVMSGVLDIFNGYGTVVRCEKKEFGVFYKVAVKFSDLKEKRRIKIATTTKRISTRRMSAKRK